MFSELNEIWTTILATTSACGGIGGVIAWFQNKKMRALEAKLKETEVNNATITAKAAEFHLYQEQLDHANGRIITLEARVETRELYWQGECERRDKRYDALWLEHNEQTQLVRRQNEQIQLEKDLNTEYERVIAEQAEENNYLNMWVCHKSDCQNGIPPRERLRGQTFDLKRIVRTHQRVKLLENKHLNKE